MIDFQPIDPTGYNHEESVWGSEPGWLVDCHISPKAEPTIAEIMNEHSVNRAKVIGGFIYTHFEFIQQEILDSIEVSGMSDAHTWITYYQTQPLAMYLIAQYDEFNVFLLHKDEGEKIQSSLDSGEYVINLGWVKLSFDEEISLSVFDLPEKK